MSEVTIGLEQEVLEAFQGVVDAVKGQYLPREVLTLDDAQKQSIGSPQFLLRHRGTWFGVGIERLDGTYFAEAFGQLPLQDPTMTRQSLDAQELEMGLALSRNVLRRITYTMLPEGYPPAQGLRRTYASIGAIVPANGKSGEEIATRLPLLTADLITAFANAGYLR